jgi:hypothetical protein
MIPKRLQVFGTNNASTSFPNKKVEVFIDNGYHLWALIVM